MGSNPISSTKQTHDLGQVSESPWAFVSFPAEVRQHENVQTECSIIREIQECISELSSWETKRGSIVRDCHPPLVKVAPRAQSASNPGGACM